MMIHSFVRTFHSRYLVRVASYHADALKSGSTKNDGKVSVYEYTAGDWIQLGLLSLSGDIQHEKFGQSVSMSGDGNNIAVSSPGAGDDPFVGIKNGKVQAFSYSDIDDEWLAVGDEIQGVKYPTHLCIL